MGGRFLEWGRKTTRKRRLAFYGVNTEDTAGRAGPGGHCVYQQLWCGADAPLRVGHFGHLQCAVCLFRGIAEAVSGDLDIFVSGLSGGDAVSSAAKICAGVFVQLRGGVLFRERCGSAPALGEQAAEHAAAGYFVFCCQLSGDLLRHRTLEPVPDADHSDGPVSAGAGGYYGTAVLEDQDPL